VSKYEERAYQVGRSKPNIAGLKNQLARLKHDLEQFAARKPSGAVVTTLKERIREVEATIAEAEANRKRESQAARNVAEEAAEADRELLDLEPFSTARPSRAVIAGRNRFACTRDSWRLLARSERRSPRPGLQDPGAGAGWRHRAVNRRPPGRRFLAPQHFSRSMVTDG